MNTSFNKVHWSVSKGVNNWWEILQTCILWDNFIGKFSSSKRQQKVIILRAKVSGNFLHIINDKFGRIIHSHSTINKRKFDSCINILNLSRWEIRRCSRSSPPNISHVEILIPIDQGLSWFEYVIFIVNSVDRSHNDISFGETIGKSTILEIIFKHTFKALNRILSIKQILQLHNLSFFEYLLTMFRKQINKLLCISNRITSIQSARTGQGKYPPYTGATNTIEYFVKRVAHFCGQVVELGCEQHSTHSAAVET